MNLNLSFYIVLIICALISCYQCLAKDDLEYQSMMIPNFIEENLDFYLHKLQESI